MEANKIVNAQNEINVGQYWISNAFETKWRSYRQKFGDDEKAMVTELTESFVHKFPYILFVSLPFFALVLKILYVRKKKLYYYDHAVFTIYQYIFSFILLLIYFILSKMRDWLHWDILRLFAFILLVSGGVYLLLALKRFYLQGWPKTTGKFLLLNIAGLFILILIFILFLAFALFQL